MTNGSEPDTVASDKERHPTTLKLFLISGRHLECGGVFCLFVFWFLFSKKDLVCIINVIPVPHRRVIVLTTIDGWHSPG